MTSKGMPNLIMRRKSVPRIKVCSDSTDTHFPYHRVNHRLTGWLKSIYV